MRRRNLPCAYVSPPYWPANGEGTSITITGSNLGTGSSSVSVSPYDIAVSNVSNNGSGTITATVTVPTTETSSVATVAVQPNYSGTYGCTGNCTFAEGGNGQAQANVAILSLSQGANLWFFGSGNNPSSAFTSTLGNTQSVITPNNVTGGSFAWSITSGADKVSFTSGSSQSTTTTSTNIVTVYSIGYSSSPNDVTIQLSWTPSGGSAITAPLTLTVDSPYELVPTGTPVSIGVSNTGDCNTVISGTNGYRTLIKYQIVSFLNIVMANADFNETLSSTVQDYTGNDWATQTPSGATTDSNGYFYDNICAYNATIPISLPPQSPLGDVAIYHRAQTWAVGSQTPGSGIEVQSNTMQKYQDHGAHNAITSPVR